MTSAEPANGQRDMKRSQKSIHLRDCYLVVQRSSGRTRWQACRVLANILLDRQTSRGSSVCVYADRPFEILRQESGCASGQPRVERIQSPKTVSARRIHQSPRLCNTLRQSTFLPITSLHPRGFDITCDTPIPVRQRNTTAAPAGKCHV